MFKSDKQKILLILKDKLILYLNEKLKYNDKIREWENKSYFEMENLQCYTQSTFENKKKEHIKWFYEQYNLSDNNSRIIEDLIKEIEKI